MTDEARLLDAERARAAAVVARDLQALEQCFDEELVYVHATGTIHDRTKLLEYVRVGPRFHEVRLEPRSVRILGNVAVIFGDLHLLLQRAGEEPIKAHSYATAVWLLREEGWCLASFQSTRVSEEN